MPHSEPRILYEHGLILGVFKPPGLPTQAPPGINSLERQLKALIRRREPSLEKVYLGVPHRLDRPVGGVMLFAKDKRGARKISRQFERRQVKKTYLACAEGAVNPAQGTWRDHLRKIPDVARAEVVPQEHPEAKEAVLHYRTVELIHGITLLEVTPLTGRTHQIRVQAASRGHPILGDEMYGSTIPFGPHFEDPRERGIALLARKLVFLDLEEKSEVQLVSPFPEGWESFQVEFAADEQRNDYSVG